MSKQKGLYARVADKAVEAAVAQVLSTMKYAAKRVQEADEDLPDGTLLRVSANAVLVEISLEIPVKSIKKE